MVLQGFCKSMRVFIEGIEAVYDLIFSVYKTHVV